MADNLPHILLVDDDQDLLATLGDILKIRGFEPVLAQTGGEALAHIEVREIDAALIDLKLDDMHGMEVLRGIKTRAPDCECILLTGNASQESAIQAAQMGAYGYFQKPFDVEQVLLSIQRAVDKRQSALALRASEEKFRTLADFTYDWEIWLDPQQQLAYVSPACERISGYRPQEFIADAGLMERIVHPDDRAIWEQHLRRHSPTGAMCEEDAPDSLDETVFRILRRDGETRWIEHACRAAHGADGKYLGRRASNRDITKSKQAEEALRIAEANYRSIFENATIGIYQSTPQGRFLSVNPAMARIFGYDTPEEMVAGVVNIEKQDYVDPADRREFQRLMIERGEAREFTSWNYRKNGERIWIQESARAVKDAQGNILYYEGFISDITERKRAEDARRQAELRYRSLFEQTHDAVFILDLEGRHLDANPRAAEMLGYTPDELLKLSFANISAQLQESRQVMERLLAGEHIPLYERIFRKKNGGLVQTEINVELVRDADGQPLHIQSVVRDITARKRIENELRESEEKYRRLVELSPDLIAIHSEGKICFANQAGLRLVGADRLEQMVGKPTLEFVAPGLRAQIAKRIQHALQNGAALPFLDEKFVRLDGSEVDVSVTAVPTTWQGKPAMQVIARDITERKLAENEVRRAKDALESAHRELQQSLEREQLLARTDDLTDLYNRRYFFKHAAREFRDALHYKRPLSIIMFDVDGFKRINDSFGHLAGDKALALVAQVTAAQVRAIDVLARYGGDEFVVLLPQTRAQQALAIAERIRISVAASRLETDRDIIALTLSMGIAEIIHTLQDESVESVIHRADEAMYNAKQAGSNRIVISEESQ